MPIGAAFRRSIPTRVVGVAAAVAIVGWDLYIAPRRYGVAERLAPLAAALLFYVLLARALRAPAHLDSLGFRLRPVNGFRPWFVKLALLGGITLFLIGGAMAFMRWRGLATTTSAHVTRADLPNWLWHACVKAPLIEEPIYRLAVCAPLVALIGRWPTIGVSGGVFAALHFRYGVPGPDNFIAGYVLGWAYLESGSLALPIVLHAFGNLCVVLFLFARPWLQV